jgi:hypothetical protein
MPFSCRFEVHPARYGRGSASSWTNVIRAPHAVLSSRARRRDRAGAERGLTRCAAGELPEIPVEVRLVVVAALVRYPQQARFITVLEKVNGTLETKYARQCLGR